jgi:hypothetical protein
LRWAFVIAAKLMLSQLRMPYSFWSRLGLFRHGSMDRTDYARKIFDLHRERAFDTPSLEGRAILELGPGDSLASAVIGKALGASRIYLVDAGNYATADLGFYRRLASDLAQSGFAAPDLSGVTSIEQMLDVCGAIYLTQGVESLKDIATGEIQYVWSHSVLEHVPVREVSTLFREFKRIMDPAGRMSHNIDFQDHLDHSLNSLRFPHAVWESAFMRGGGFYTNRIRAADLHAAIEAAGFRILHEDFGRWPKLPVKREALAQPFRSMSEEVLKIRTSHLLAQPRQGANV